MASYGATGHLKLEHYEKLGRIEGSIEAAVEQAFKAADADPKVPKDKQARLALLRRGYDSLARRYRSRHWRAASPRGTSVGNSR